MRSIPLFSSSVVAGFPSPADDYIEQNINLHDVLIKHPAATYYVRAQGSSMKDIGIMNGDLIIVDRALSAKHGDIVIAALEGEFTCKLLDTRNQRLLSANADFKPICVRDNASFTIEGVVTHSISSHHHVRTY